MKFPRDLTGLRFGALVVVGKVAGRADNSGYWLCQCDCGVQKAVARTNLCSKTRSCGGSAHRAYKGHFKHGHSYEAEFNIWRMMVIRCTRSNWPGWKWYGGRGIKVCDRWKNSYEHFLADVGRRPSPQHSIDRIDVDGNYEPSNVRWATLAEQAKNKRAVKAKAIAFGGKTQSLAEWARECGITRQALSARLKISGWSLERALSTPGKDVAEKTHLHKTGRASE